jgi:hypothetical protein
MDDVVDTVDTEDPGPSSATRRRRRGLVAIVVVGLVVGAVGAVVRRPDPGVRVMEVGFSRVSLRDDGAKALSWGAVVGNPRGDQAAQNTRIDIEVLDEHDDVIDEGSVFVDVVMPGQGVGIGGVEERSHAFAVRLEVVSTETWGSPEDLRTIAVDDVEVSYTHENVPLLTFDITPSGHGPMTERTAYVVLRDTHGRIIAGVSRWTPSTFPGIEPGTPTTEHVVLDYPLPDLDAVEIYAVPNPHPTSY